MHHWVCTGNRIKAIEFHEVNQPGLVNSTESKKRLTSLG
jgi:hypothetical protein